MSQKPQEKILSPEELDHEVFFSENAPRPDFEHWAKMDYWNLDEALYLSVSLLPRGNYDRPKSFDKRLSPLSNKFGKLNELVKRAKKVKELTDPTKPITYIEWTKNKHIDVPKELEQKVRFFAGEKMSSNHSDKPLDTRERDTFLKIILGMAIDGYGYDPTSTKSPTPKEIEGVLDRLCLPVSDDTIRVKLKEAKKMLSLDAL